MSLNKSIVENAALDWFGELCYPLDLQEKAIKTVLAQAELLSAGWSEG